MPRRRRTLLLAAAVVTGIVAVGLARALLRGGHTSLDAALRHVPPGTLYPGRSAGALPLTRIQRAPPLMLFVYGECALRCVRVLDEPLAGHNPVAYLRGRRRLPCRATTVRGAPAARFVGLEVYTGNRTVVVFAGDAAEELALARALRPVGEAAVRPRLEAPALDLHRGLAACARPRL